MKPKILMLAALFACGTLADHAESLLTTIVDGVPETRELVRMTFDSKDPDTVTLHFADASTLDADMSLVSLLYDHSGSTAIEDITAESKARPGVYNLKGQRVADKAEGLVPGIYIINGQKTLVK
ncbi:MAG: hypothetical protein K2H94_05145 [Duncaniella sp.]|nr:hypothetical protein [Duncaniella sp.]